MRLKTQIDKVRRMDQLIRRKATGCPSYFSSKMGVSKATLHRYLDDLRSLGAPVIYSRERQTYYYKEAYELEF